LCLSFITTGCVAIQRGSFTTGYVAIQRSEPTDKYYVYSLDIRYKCSKNNNLRGILLPVYLAPGTKQPLLLSTTKTL
jgi:hypothetical protein